MNNRVMRMNKIRFFDLFIFTILAVISEFLSSYFFKKVGSQFYLSFSTLIFIIASIRWGAYSVAVAVLSGIPLLFTQNQNDMYSGILYYCIANVFAVIPIIVYGRRDRNLIVNSPYEFFLYILSILICMSISKGIALIIINHDYLGFYKYFVSMIFTFSINVIILFLFRRFKSELLIDMNHYLLDTCNDDYQKDPGFKIDEVKGEEKNENGLKNERIENESNH